MVDTIENIDYDDLPLWWIGYNDGWENRLEELNSNPYTNGYTQGKFDREHDYPYRDGLE